MAYQLIERPHGFSFSKNEIRYVFNITNPESIGCAMEIELYTVPVSTILVSPNIYNPNRQLVCKQTLTPTADGKVIFYCEDFLHSYLDWQMPPLASNDVTGVTSQIRKYYIRYRQISKQDPTPAWASDHSALRVVVKGGVAKEKFDRNNFFLNRMPLKPFLTWQPADHFIGTEERRYLTYLHTGSVALINPIQLLLKARVVYTDGTTDAVTKNFPSLSTTLLFHLPAGLQQLGLYGLQPDKQVWFYDVSVEDEEGNIYAAPYRLYADYDRYYDVFSFIYHNSISGIDTLRIRGDYDKELVRDYTEIQQAITGYGGEVLPTENAAINISMHKVYKGDAGYMNTKRMQEACEDLLYSESVYREVAGRLLRVVNMQKTQAMGAKTDTIFSFPLQWRYTFNNTQFTPEAIDLGAGTTNTVDGISYGVCTAPGNLVVTEGAIDGDGQHYDLTWDEVANKEGYELQYKKAADTEWSEPLEVATAEAELVLEDPDDYMWRVRTKCGTNDYSGYANGPGFSLEEPGAVCGAPGAINVILVNLSGNNATIKFTWPSMMPGVQGYIIEWKEYGASVWNQHYTTVLEHTVVLNKDVQYERRIRSMCNSGGDMSPYYYGANFIPSNLVGSCTAPTNLVVNLPNTSIAKAIATINGFQLPVFSWTNSGGGASYEIQYREKSTATWIIQNGVQSGFIGSAFNNKTYEWRLRTNCTGGGFSNFINGPDFETTL